MIPKLNHEVYRVYIYKFVYEKDGTTKEILNDTIFMPENIEKYRIPHEIASYVESRLRADMLTEEEREQAKQEEKTAYNKGLTDAWEAAKKCLHNNDLWSFCDLDPGESMFTKYSAGRAIAKIKEYEDRKAEIKVGDEVVENDDMSERGVVTYITLTGGRNLCTILWDDGRFCGCYESDIKKTGRHFPQVAELLKAMKEEG